MQRRRLVALAAIILCAHPAFASKTGWVNTETLNVRKSPSTSSDRVGSLNRGHKVTVTAFRDDRWCRISLSGGKSGWVREEYLSFSKPAAASAGASASSSGPVPCWVEPAVINVREKPDIGAGVVRQLPQGTKMFVTGRDGAWRKVHTLGGTSGWVRVDLLTFDADKGRKLSPTAKAPTTARPAWISANVANVRNGPSAGYSRIGQFTRGAKVYMVGHQDDWVRVKSPNGTGWVHADLLETDIARGRRLASAGTERDKAYCVGTVVNLRAGPSTSHGELGEVRQGATLWIRAEQNNWCKVQTQDGKTGWIAGWYVRRHAARSTVAPEPGSSPAPKTYMTRFPASTRKATRVGIQPFKAWIAEDHTNIRYGPSVEKDVKFQLDRRTQVMVVDTEGQWCKIQAPSGNTGWAAGWVLDFQPPGEPEVTVKVNGETEEAKSGWVNRPTVNVRAAASGDADVVATADVGTEVVITDRQGEWYKVALSNGTTGWVNKDLIETRAERAAEAQAGSSETPSTGGGSSMGRSVVREAMKHLGKAYVRGASGNDAFDCSGFTSYVYRQFGIKLARTTTGQYLQGRPVSRDDLQPGDVVVFRNTYRAGISHVGIYVGQGRFIHASNSRSGVKISDLDSSYYAQRYAGSRRMF